MTDEHSKWVTKQQNKYLNYYRTHQQMTDENWSELAVMNFRTMKALEDNEKIPSELVEQDRQLFSDMLEFIENDWRHRNV